MLYPVGFKPEDFQKPLIGIASTWSNVTPCNMRIDKLALEAEKGSNEAGGKAMVFNTITVSDAVSEAKKDDCRRAGACVDRNVAQRNQAARHSDEEGI